MSRVSHILNPNTEILFISIDRGDVIESKLSELLNRIKSETGLISLGLNSQSVSDRSAFHAVASKSNFKGVYGLVLPAHLLDQAWRSHSSEAFLIEIYRSLSRLGHDFVHDSGGLDLDVGFMSVVTGRWNGWRNFSKRARFRAAGEAISGSVLSETLEVLGTSMPRYARWLKRETISPESKRVLEIGAGTGTMTVLFAESAEVVAFEPSESARSALVTNTREFTGVSAVSSMEEAAKLGPYDEVMLINVLEHVEHDTALLRQARQLLVKGGRVTVLSPAHNMLFSDFDASIGHVRRYTRSSLEKTFKASGYAVVESRYSNAIGAVLWFLVNRVAGKSEANSKQTELYDNMVVPIGELVNRLRFRPFGQSVIAHGRDS